MGDLLRLGASGKLTGMAPTERDPDAPTSHRRRGLALHWQILIGLALGLVVGLVINLMNQPAADGTAGALTRTIDGGGFVGGLMGFIAKLNVFIGDMFIRFLRFIAAPIVLFSLIAGAASLNDIRKIGRIGGKTVGIYLVTTALAITIGLVFANVVKPGTWVNEETRESMAAAGAGEAAAKVGAAQSESSDLWRTIENVVPTNPFDALASGNMLQIVFFALAIGIGLSMIPEKQSRPVIVVAQALTDTIIKIIHIVMLFAPYAVFALLAKVMATMGLGALGALAAYVVVVIAALAVMVFGVYPAAVALVARVRLGRFYGAIAPAQLMAFSSSSSSATLPVTLDCVEKRLGVSEEVTGFVIPVGATINMDGTGLYQGVAALFILQLFGIQADLGQQLTIVLTATLASIGTAGVPGVGILMLVIVLQSLNVDDDVMTQGIAIILGVDRILDMCRTTCNVTGDCMVAAVVGQTEGELASEDEVRARRADERASGLDEHPKHDG
ncbi:MAG: dicarboxylate/amino acid:cation symporter [Planctomycetota bacterium]